MGLWSGIDGNNEPFNLEYIYLYTEITVYYMAGTLNCQRDYLPLIYLKCNNT